MDLTFMTTTKSLTLVLLVFAALLAPLARRDAQAVNHSSIRGQLIDRATGAPLAGELGLAIHSSQGIALKHARANEQGEFAFNDLPSGAFHLSTKLDDYAVERMSLNLQADEARVLDLRLVKAARLSGGVTDSAQTPLADARVQIFYEQEAGFTNSYQWEEGDARTDEAGRFTLEIHPERAFVVQASRAGFLSEAAPPQTNVRDIALALTRGVAFAGVARDTAGAPLAEAQIQLRDERERADLARFLPFEVLQQRQPATVTQADGAFRFDNLRPARYALVVTHPDAAPQRRFINVARQRQIKLSVARQP